MMIGDAQVHKAYMLNEFFERAKKLWRKPNGVVIVQHTHDVRYVCDTVSALIYEYLYLDDIWALVAVTDSYLHELPGVPDSALAGAYTDLVNGLDSEVDLKPSTPVITQEDLDIKVFHEAMAQAFRDRLLAVAELSRQQMFEPRDKNRFVVYKPGKDTVMVLDRSWDRLHHFDIRSDHYAWLGVETRWGFVKASARMVKPDIEVGRLLAKILPVVMATYETSKTNETSL